MDAAEKLESITVWVPALKRGAPSNRSSMPFGVYATRAEALKHEHWNNQAPWATAKRITVVDVHGTVDSWMPWYEVVDYVLGVAISAGAGRRPEWRAEWQAIEKLIRSGECVAAVQRFLRQTNLEHEAAR